MKILKIETTIYQCIELKDLGLENITVSDLQEKMVDTVKWQSGHKLKSTDWAVVKCTELEMKITEKYPDIANERAEIRQWSNDTEENILSCTSIEELVALDIKLG